MKPGFEMSKGMAVSVLIGLLGAGVLRIALAWRRGGDVADAVGITAMSIALLGLTFLIFGRKEKKQ